MEKLKMQSLDVTGNNIDKIAQLFPNCVTERIGKDGKSELAIDFDKLKAELTNDVMEEGEERYQFTWPGKRAASRLANETTTQTLRPCREESVDFDNTQNLYIEGDNLEVLKVLRETYLGKVKMIYIDPPYNTGNDFVYNDDFAQGIVEFEQNSGLFDEEGNQAIDPMQRNTESNGRFHTDWLNMIYPRLKVAKDLLTDDGVIFISIDDNEQKNLKNICDEVFGEANFLIPFIWHLPRGINAGLIARSHEYILCYAKNISAIQRFNRLNDNIEYSIERCNKKIDSRHPESIINFPVGVPYEGKDQILSGVIEGSEKITINGEMIFKNGKLDKPVSLAAGWTMKSMIIDWLKGKEVYDTKGQKIDSFFFKENGRLYSKKILSTYSIKSVLQNVPDTQKARMEMEELFGSQDIFSYPKTKELPKIFSKLSCNQDSIILDFFSGSSTTAHAVMQLNAEDRGKRKFIMVQLPEPTDKKSEAYKAGYKNICEIGKERIRRAGKKIKDDELDKLNEELNYLVSQKALVDNDFWCNPNELENKIKGIEEKIKDLQRLDTGFRVLKLDSSNMNDVYYTPEEFSLNTLFSENVKEDRTAEDLLFQVMLDLGIELSAKIEKQEIAGKEVFLVDENYLVACFDKDVNETTITEIAKMHPVYFVMRDASAATDNVIDNFDQLFEAYSKDTVRKIL